MYDARNKVRGLANALGYDPIEATRLATAVSEAARELRRSNREPRISVALAMEFSPPQLVLDFENRGETPELIGLAGFFDGLSRKDRSGRLPGPSRAEAAAESLVRGDGRVRRRAARADPESLARGVDGRGPTEESRARAAQRGARNDRGPANRWS